MTLDAAETPLAKTPLFLGRTGCLVAFFSHAAVRPSGMFGPLPVRTALPPFFFDLRARLRGRTATQRSKKGSEKVLGRVLGKGFSEGSEKGACYGFYSKKGF